MRRYVFHIGSNDALATAEVGTVLGYDCILAVYKNFMLVETELVLDQLFLDRMGSIIELYEVYLELPVSAEDQESVIESICDDLDQVELDSKVTYAFSSNFLHNQFKLQILKKVKKNLKSSEHNSRFIENVTAASLKDAGVLNENLYVYGAFNFKINLEKSVLLICKLNAIQNIDKYALRDYSRPYRSAKLGMLPPKLAQIMINLAVCSDEQSKKGEKLVYDPFCGTGTVLMESLLMGHSAQGSDIQEVNIVGTNDNIEWLASEAGVDVAKVSRVFELDATKISSADLKDVDCIVTEGFLGVPKQGNEESSALVKELEELGNLYYDFLKAVSSSVKVNNSIVVVLTLPVYRGNGDNSSKNYFIENLVEKFGTLGYSVSALVPENKLGIRHKDSVLYKRSDQKVLRQVYRLTLTSK